MGREKLCNLPEVEISKKDGKSLSKPGAIVEYKWELIKSQKGQYCRGCSFNSNTKIGGCPYYMDEGRKIYPCLKYGIIFKKLRRDIDKKI